MKYTIVPCFWVGDLETALEAQYGSEFIQEIRATYGDLRRLMFDDFYMNDVCCKYYIDEMEEYEGHSWQDETLIRLENCVKTFLRDLFPNFNCVIVDVMW